MPEGTPIADASPVSATLGYASPDTADPWPRWIERGLVIAIGIVMLAGAVQAGLWVRLWGQAGGIAFNVDRMTRAWDVQSISLLSALVLSCVGTAMCLAALFWCRAIVALGAVCVALAIVQILYVIAPQSAPPRMSSLFRHAPPLVDVAIEIVPHITLAGVGLLLMLGTRAALPQARRRSFFINMTLTLTLLHVGMVLVALTFATTRPQRFEPAPFSITTLHLLLIVLVATSALTALSRRHPRCTLAAGILLLVHTATMIYLLVDRSTYMLFPTPNLMPGFLGELELENLLNQIRPELITLPLIVALLAAWRLSSAPDDAPDRSDAPIQ